MSARDEMLRARLQAAPMAKSPKKIAMPVVLVPALDQIEVVVSSASVLPVEQAELEQRLVALLAEHATVTVRAHNDPIQLGDQVLVDCVARIETNIVPGTFRKDLVVPMTDDCLFPELLAKLPGRRVGDVCFVDVTVPKDSDPIYGGSRVKMELRLRGARTMTLPDLERPETLALLGRGATIDEVAESIADEIQEDRAEALVMLAENMVLDAVMSKVDVTAPPALVDEELRKSWYAAEGLAMAGVGIVFREQQIALAAWMNDAETRYEAERRVRIGLVLGAIARAEGFVVTEAELREWLEAFCAQNGGTPETIDLKADDRTALSTVADKLLHLRCVQHVMQKVRVRFE